MDDGLVPHQFEPVPFSTPSGPIATDWCGFGALATTDVDDAAFCGRLADDPVHQNPDAGTSGGVVLTDEVIQALADEAEAGYDPDRLRPRTLINHWRWST